MPAYLRPVPLCHLTDEASTKAYPFSLRTGGERVSRRTRNHLRTVLGLGSDDRLVMLTLASWQKPEHGNPDGLRIARGVQELLFHYLSQLPANVYVVAVGERFDSYGEFPRERVRCFPPCTPDRFNLLVNAADLFLSLNIAATTLTRAVLSGTPPLVLFNSHSLHDTDDIDRLCEDTNLLAEPFLRSWLLKHLPTYPFRMWPLGFYDFLTPLLTNNPYLATFPQVELFDAHSVHGALKGMLFDRAIRESLEDERSRYIEALDGLGETYETFECMAESIGILQGGFS
ncbi:MAG: DUF6365 family protein [Actinomycetota bacterium]|nr:DUF6365 family protein [Actinomycetota bacterium]